MKDLINSLKKDSVVIIIFGIITYTACKFINIYSTIWNNQMAMLQMSNDNTSYLLYKSLTDMCGNLRFVLLLIYGIIVLKFIYKHVKIYLKRDEKKEVK